VEAAPLAAEVMPCTSSDSDGVVCNGGVDLPGVSGLSKDNEGVIGSSTNGRGVYGASVSLEGGYFSSTDGDGLLAYTLNGYSGHFTGGRGVIIDAPGVAGSPALTANGPARVALPAAAPGVVPVCGVLDTASGLFSLSKCDDRLDRLEAQVAALTARLATMDGGGQ
jgi:hypothetical protein